MENKKQQAPITILLADDDEDDRFFFEEVLKEMSLATRLKTVDDGAKLMDYLSKGSQSLPDVLFLDINMPKKNGFECLTAIKHNDRLKPIPVVIYSTALDKDGASKLYNEGAHYYLRKCDFNNLKRCIEQVLVLLTESFEQPTRDQFILGSKQARA